MRNRIAALAASVAVLAPTAAVVAASPASAHTHTCVTGDEFRKVRDGMTKTRVHQIFDVIGRRTNIGSGGEGREYRSCVGDPDWSYVSVDYERSNGAMRVWFKWRYVSY